MCRRIRADALLREVPIILLSTLDHRVSRPRGIKAGADDFISKPFDRSELRTRVRTITRLKRYRSLLAECTRFEWVVEHADDGYLLVGRPGTWSMPTRAHGSISGLRPMEISLQRCCHLAELPSIFLDINMNMGMSSIHGIAHPG